eukprot:5197491-Heterocapsa_arctica.AAC.1
MFEGSLVPDVACPMLGVCVCNIRNTFDFPVAQLFVEVFSVSYSEDFAFTSVVRLGRSLLEGGVG